MSGQGPLTWGSCRRINDVCREIPQELLKVAMGKAEVDVDITDKRDEMYVKPKPKVVAFSGAGRKLGRYDVCNGDPLIKPLTLHSL